MTNFHRMIVASFFFLLFSNSQSVHAQWMAQTNGLSFWKLGYAIDASDSITAVFSTSEGTYKTVDGGNNWRGLSVPAVVMDISMIDSSHIWIGDWYGKIYATHDGGGNWELQYNDTTKTKFMNYVEMFDLNNGVAMGDHFDPRSYPAGPGLILNTSDGGNNWISVNDSAFGGWSGDMWRRIDFTDANTGYFFASGINPQKLYKTNNGGSNWHVTNFPSSYIQILHFYDSKIGLAESNSIYRTLDGGINWETFLMTGLGWGNDIEFATDDPSKVWMTDNRSLYFSSDTGKTWTKQLAECKGRDIVFVDHYNGWVLCDDGAIFYTTSGGITNILTENENTPKNYALFQNCPNPFNTSTRITYSLAKDGIVKLSIFNLLGKEIKTLVNQMQSPGTYEVDWNAGDLPSGTYFCRLEVGEFQSMRKLVLLK